MELNLAILASGSGSTGEVLFPWTKLVVVNREDAGMIDLVRRYNDKHPDRQIGLVVAPRSKYRVESLDQETTFRLTQQRYGQRLLDVFDNFGINFISQNGWDVLTPKNVTDVFKGRILNSHPAPLDPGYPDFGGKGMHGLAVHAAVLYFAQRVRRPFTTEVTLHQVTEVYDLGELAMRTKVAILEGDTPETLQARVKEVEKKQNVLFWKTVAQTGKISVIKRPLRLIKPNEEGLLEEAKRHATEKYPKG